jgi:phosphoglycolate phosphatase
MRRASCRVRGILFDKDGTIVDYWKTWVPINREAALFAAGGDRNLAAELLRAGGHDPETDHVAPNAPLAAAGIDQIAACFSQVLGERAPANLIAGIDCIFREGGEKYTVLLPGAETTLREMRQRGFRIGLATNDTKSGLQASLARLDVLPLCDFVAACDSGHGAKPDPGMALAFCAQMGLEPHQAAVVGDSTHDLEMASSAGCGMRIAVLSGTGTHAVLAPWADIILDSVATLPTLPQFARELG